MELSVLNEHFDIVAIKTIPRNASRQQEIKADFGDALKYDFFLGHDGENIDVQDLEAKGLYSLEMNLKARKHRLTDNQIAAHLGHIEFYKKISESNYENGIILEDDVIILRQNLKHLKSSLEHLPENWDLLYLGYAKNNTRKPLPMKIKTFLVYPLLNYFRIKTYDLDAIGRIYLRRFSKYWHLAGVHNGSHALAVNKNGARKILDFALPIRMETDFTLQRMILNGKINAYAMAYDVFDQRWDLPSSIGDRFSWK